jgi:AraC family transcriptional activator of tynA and feaB
MQAWSTLDFPSHLQFSYWREVLCEAFITLNPERKQAGAFAGAVTAHPLAGVNVTTVSSIDQRVLRGAREIRKMPLEFYFLNLQLKGECRFAQRGREALVKPNEFAIVDTTEPYELDYRGNWELYSFRIPKRMLDPLLANPNQSTATLVTKRSRSIAGADHGGIDRPGAGDRFRCSRGRASVGRSGAAQLDSQVH